MTVSSTLLQSPALTAEPLPADTEAQILKTIQQIPVMSALDIKIERFAKGQCMATMKHDPATDGYFECFHGGLLMTAADTAACYAVLTLTHPNQKMATTDMNIRFLSPCLTDVRVVATVIKPGKTLNPVQVDLYDMNHKRVAVAQVTYMLIDEIRR